MALGKRFTRKNTECISWLLLAAFDKTKQKKTQGKMASLETKLRKNVESLENLEFSR